MLFFIDYSSEMKWVQIGELPDVIVYINGESALYPCFLVNAVRDKEEAGKNKERSFIWTLANCGGSTIQWKGIKNWFTGGSSEVLGSNKVILITQAKSRKDLDMERRSVKTVRTYHQLLLYIYFSNVHWYIIYIVVLKLYFVTNLRIQIVFHYDSC